VISLPFCLLRQAWIWTQVLTSLTDSTLCPLLVPVPHRVPLCIEALTPTFQEDKFLLQIKLSISTWWGLLPVARGCTPVTKEVTNHHLCNPRQSPKKCGNLKLRYGTLRQFSRNQCFIVPAQTQWTHVQRLNLENKGVSPYILLQAGYRSKKQSSTHIWLHVISLAISFPQCYVTFIMFQFFFFFPLWSLKIFFFIDTQYVQDTVVWIKLEQIACTLRPCISKIKYVLHIHILERKISRRKLPKYLQQLTTSSESFKWSLLNSL
jgi:hypothetical protein